MTLTQTIILNPANIVSFILLGVFNTPTALFEKAENATTVVPSQCNNPIVGKGAVVDYLGSSVACLLCQDSNINHIIDGNLGNYAVFDMPLSLSGANPVVSVRDINAAYPAGYRAGFVVKGTGGLMDISTYGSFRLKTYKNGVLQETANYGGGGSLEVNLTTEIDGAKRLSFVTSLPFDEVELWLTSTATGLTKLWVYYAFEDADVNCDYNCLLPVTPPSFSSSINGAETGISGLCLFCSITNTANVVDANTSNYATINLTANASGTAKISVKAGTSFPAGYQAGFAVSKGSGATGLLPSNLLGNTTINTYLNGVLQESVLASSPIANIGLVPGSSTINLISFRTIMAFDEVQLRIGGISVASNTRVHYAFVRPDADNDGMPDCVDKCNGGNDLMDTDGDGLPDGCEIDCTIDGGPDIYVCPVAVTAQLPPAGAGQAWSALPGNPGNATIDNTGFISNLEQEGIYRFELREGSCMDTVRLIYQMATLSETCNDPLTGNSVVVDNTAQAGGVCLLCGAANVGNLTDGDQSNYITYNDTLSLFITAAIVSLKDISTVYPIGTRTGYVVSAHGGLLNASALSALEIRTYLNNVYRETGSTGGPLQASVLPGAGNRVRISFVTTKSFDEVELVAKGGIDLITSMRIYYAFTEPDGTCGDQPVSGDCEEMLSAGEKYGASIDYTKTGLSKTTCSQCSIDNIGNLIDADIDTYSSMNLTGGVGGEGSIAVKSSKRIPAGNETGFIVSGGAQLLETNVLQGLGITTFLEGIVQEDVIDSSGFLQTNLLIDGSNKGFVSFRANMAFDEVKLTVSSTVGVLSDLKIYSAFIRSDVDGDGTPDCYDKCCGSPDYLDSDENGLVDCVDPQCFLLGMPSTVNDTFYFACPTLQFVGSVKLNDSNLASPFFSIMSTPAKGTASIAQNGNFQYNAASYFCGTDKFTYRVCNGNNGDCCSIGTVVMSMVDNTPPVLDNVPADITIQCDDYLPNPLQLQAMDDCPAIYITMDESMVEPMGAACKMYQITRTWEATDHCGNSDSDAQVITVEDHVPPSIFYIYTLPNGKKLIAGIAEQVSNCWKRIIFPSPFSNTPIVFTQIISEADPSAAVVQQRSTTNLSVELKLKEEENADGLHGGEKVAWIAVEPGTVPGSAGWEASFTNSASSTWSPLFFSQTYIGTPAVIASVQSTASSDPVGIRIKDITHSSAQVFLQEETSYDAETAHSAETLGFMAATNNATMIDAQGMSFGESGTAQATHEWTAIDFRNKYTNPVVVAGAISNNDNAPVAVRIRNITTQGFEIQLNEWDYEDGPHATEQVSYFVVEGSLLLPPGQSCAWPTELNTVGWDNCDLYVPIAHTSTTEDENGVILVNHHWEVTDQCNNTRSFNRTDTCEGVSLKLKMLLAGALLHNGNNGLMRDDLRAKGLLPGTEPYSGLSSFQHVGYGGGEIMKQGIDGIEGQAAIVDWVFLEIRNAENPQLVMATQSALLQRNGRVVNMHGDSVITILGLVQNDYFIAVRHRNHLGIMTQSPYFLTSGNPPFINLASPAMTAIHDNDKWPYHAIGATAALWSGDLNSDGKAIYQGPENDVAPLFAKVVLSPDNTDHIANYILESYGREDLDLDGRAIYQGPNNDRAMLLLYTVLSHPINSAYYSNYIVNEILP